MEEIKRQDGTPYGFPEPYLERMKEEFGESYDAFLKSYAERPKKGIRFHGKKARPETVEALREAWNLRPVPWCADGYYYDETAVRPGKSPYHDAGVFYIQEPSAMLTAERAEIRETERVLDLCAAPGGKSTQAAVHAGLLVSNEPVLKRARILSSNIERMGFTNVIVTSAMPKELSAVFPEYFDKIIVDAPCSGEGMMRRDAIAVTEWSEENVALCIARQREILEEAFRMLKPGGRIVYSTCTFERGENEAQAEAFTAAHEELRLCSMERILPHLSEGEGHFCAVIEKNGGAAGERKPLSEKETEALLSGAEALLRCGKVHILRRGLEKGSWITGKHKGEKRYEPSHAEAMAMDEEALSRRSLNLFSEADALRYLRGESLFLSGMPKESYLLSGEGDGYLAVCFSGYPLGFGKLARGTVKNHYPKGLRRLS